MTPKYTRRYLLAGAGVAALALVRWPSPASAVTSETFEVTKTDEEWRKLLNKQQYDVLRKQGTEYPGSSPLNHEKRKGTFACAGCDLPLFSSDTKFESGTGWPSFWQPLPDAIGTTVDKAFLMTRTEVHCRRCGGHLGHVFDDGPKPTGLRYCMNGVALKFIPAEGAPPA
jgi:peptide-methionine (R)-S-oxide reductase